MISLIKAKQWLGISDKGVSITGNGSLATATSADHQLKDGDIVEITSTTNFNGTYSVTRISASQFSFTHSFIGTQSGLISHYDFKLNVLIAGVTEDINSYTGVKWEESLEEETAIVDCPEDGIIYLPKMPALEITSIIISTERDFEDSEYYEELTTADFLFYKELGKVELLQEAREIFGSRQSVKITYKTDSFPDGIKSAAYSLLSYYFKMENDSASNVLSITNNNESKTFDKSMPEYIRKKLDRYVRASIPGFARTPKNIYF